ncbi:FAD-binding dehydrogenase [Gandjariella thermophila]|uniref:FAD-binding dehydrogenase n=1 Tax=Gandjariella thermophila TaxID=1931992 RepID=A0A4D4J438_9PSEU|nr:FAD-binding dehydrogenase [Gandjariella thermophila]
MIGRRAFLRVAGLAAVTVATSAATAACGRAGPPATSVAATPTTLPATPAAGGPPDWSALRARLAGTLVLPGDRDYDAARRSYNPLFDARRPAAVARCARPEDVQACLEAAARSGIPVAARSGGHSYAGYSTPDRGLVVDLGGMAGVDVRPDGTAVVGAGARLIDVYAALAAAGRCLPAGSCPSVGVAGLTLGGGVGVLTRKYGLTCDRVSAMSVVTADGRLRAVAEDAEPDLFWALRGGGGGNFGVVTSFTFRTEPAPDLTVFALTFPAGSAGAVLGGWQQWVRGAPDELWTNCVVSGGSPPSVRVGGCYVGSPDGLSPLLDDLVRRVGTAPASRYAQAKGYLDAMRYFAGCGQRSVASCRPAEAGGQLGRESFVASSAVLAAPAADPDRVAALVAGQRGTDLLFDSLGGAVAGVRPDATAFPHRSALATVQIYRGTDAAGQRSAARTVGAVRDGLAGLLGAAAYVNYVDPALRDWAGAYYGDNAARLREVARRYDPDRVLAFDQGLA